MRAGRLPTSDRCQRSTPCGQVFYRFDVVCSQLQRAGVAQSGRAAAFQVVGRGFESRLPLHFAQITTVDLKVQAAGRRCIAPVGTATTGAPPSWSTDDVTLPNTSRDKPSRAWVAITTRAGWT